jgi:hypothetical protein
MLDSLPALVVYAVLSLGALLLIPFLFLMVVMFVGVIGAFASMFGLGDDR